MTTLSVLGTVLSVGAGVLAAAIVAGTLIRYFVQKKRGKTGCGCDCAHCGGCAACGAHKREEDASRQK